MLEVLAALTIFVLGVTALYQLISAANDRAMQSMRAKAILLCKSKMNEIIAGAVPLQSQQGMPFEERIRSGSGRRTVNKIAISLPYGV